MSKDFTDIELRQLHANENLTKVQAISVQAQNIYALRDMGLVEAADAATRMLEEMVGVQPKVDPSAMPDAQEGCDTIEAKQARISALVDGLRAEGILVRVF